MNFTIYTDIINHQIEKCQNMLTKKRAEYANDNNPVMNFTRSKELLGCNTTVWALAGHMDKHTISIYDMIKQHENGVRFPQEKWTEKITDHINYLLLLQVVLAEEIENEVQPAPEKISILDAMSMVGFSSEQCKGFSERNTIK